MTQKIDISEEAYKKLLELKKNNESFSKLILRIINEKEKEKNKCYRRNCGRI